jgi:hypothetical protein
MGLNERIPNRMFISTRMTMTKKSCGGRRGLMTYGQGSNNVPEPAKQSLEEYT